MDFSAQFVGPVSIPPVAWETDNRASLRPFFAPHSVAVIGASRDPESIGYRLLDCIVVNRFRGAIYPINPRATSLAGLPTYSSILAVPAPVDLALIAVSRDNVQKVVDECVIKGVPALVVITAGFAECGAEGRRLQNELLAKVRKHGMRLIGPNCLGLVTNETNLNAVFVPVSVPVGKLAMSSDSGALGLALLQAARRLDLGVSSFVSVGNRADVSSNDLLEYWEDDPNTEAILLYLESFGNPGRFAPIARRISRRKPIVAVKAGRTKAGSRAAGSHTAALAANEVAVEALFRQTGILRAETLEDMLDLATALAHQPLPEGRRVAVLTNAGGPAILCADACEAGGLVLPTLSADVQARLAEFLPPAASLANPVDMIASATPEHFRRAVHVLLAADEIDALIVVFVSAGPKQSDGVAHALADGVRAARQLGRKQPVLACWMAEPNRHNLSASDQEKIPCYPFPEEPGRALAKLAVYADWRRRPPGTFPDLKMFGSSAARVICQGALNTRGEGWLTTEETQRLLEAVRLPVSPGGVVKTADEAVGLARDLGFPVALKLASRRILHKTDVGGVCLNLTNETALRSAFAEIRERLAGAGRLPDMDGVLVQPMVADGTEVLVGVTHDPLFGPLVGFGLGGVYAEVLGDICFRVCPLTDQDAHDLITSVRAYPLFQGYRGHPAADVAAIEDILLRVSQLAIEVPQIREMDLNPVFALAPGQGCRVVDARIYVGAIGGFP